MLKIATCCQRAALSLSILSQRQSKILALISYLLPFAIIASPASAVNPRLGVVKTKENTSQWEEITKRIKATGVDYCIVDGSKWQDETDFGGIGVLFLPNVDNIEQIQAAALERWIDRGGRVIVTGPTGNLSLPEVRTQLRSLFGAYWGFSNSFPITLEVVDGQLPLSQQGLASTLVGGTLIPTAVDSQPAAIWLTDERLPAVVVSNRATVIGWRWGMEGVASPAFDTAWLTATLNRYGLGRQSNLSLVKRSEPTPCNEGNPLMPSRQEAPILPQEQSRTLPGQSQAKPSIAPSVPFSSPAPEEFVPPSSNYNGALGLSPERVKTMNQELESLIARFESTLLAAEAANSSVNSSTENAIAQSLNNRVSTSADSATFTKANTANGWSHRAITEARERLEKFHHSLDQGNYTQAREQWIQARRTLWDNYPTARSLAQPETRAMWLDRATIVKARSEADLAKIFDRMAEAGINTVFFETLNASYPIYPSRIAPEQNPLTRGWNPLQAAVKLAHERGMELHAWVWAFAAANQRHNQVLNQPLDYLGPVLSRHPDWAISDRKGNVFDYGSQYRKAFLDPANPEVQRYLLALLEEIVSQYDVDGVQLDYIRYPFQDLKYNRTFGYSEIARSQFKQISGVDPIEISPSHPLWSGWTSFRIRQVDNFVATASARLKQKRPDLILSVAVFPMERRERLFRLQQNWEEWGRNGWVDAIVLMTYALDTVNLEETTKFLSEHSVAGSSLLIPGLRLLSVPDPVTFDQIQYLRNLPIGGYALFAAENFTPDLQAIFQRTQGSRSSSQLEPLPHRQPFQAAVARYKALQREWNYLLASDRLMIDEVTLQEWGEEVDALGKALERLSEKPSREDFTSAQATLVNFRRQFDRSMSQQKIVQPYQVQAWANRLEALDRLLSYGERIVLKEDRRSVAEGSGNW